MNGLSADARQSGHARKVKHLGNPVDKNGEGIGSLRIVSDERMIQDLPSGQFTGSECLGEAGRQFGPWATSVK